MYQPTKKGLTDRESLNVSRRINDKFTIRKLGFHLGLKDYTIKSILEDNKHSVKEAAYKMLTSWLQTQGDRAEAYNTLLAALKHPDVKLNHIASEVFGDNTTGK